MAPKADVEGAVNPITPLEEDDDPFLVRNMHTAGHCTLQASIAYAKIQHNTALHVVLRLWGVPDYESRHVMGQQHPRRGTPVLQNRATPAKLTASTALMPCCAVCWMLQGIWVSRPASYNPLISFLNEAVMTFMFLFLVNMMTARWGGCESRWSVIAVDSM